LAALPVLAMITLAGCSDASPTSTFDLRQGTTRAVELIDQRGDAVQRVELKTPTDDLYLRMDCIGDEDGEIVIAIGDVGEGSVPCTSESGRSSGFIGMSDFGSGPLTDFDVTVTVPKGARWSAAVDVKPADG
jgi:hypothetical protein